jgi:aryl-alcohol dehydrogenase-like predicted oxidoreductase
LQLHCPHPDVYERAEVFGILDDLVTAGKVRHYGVSVETCEEALRAIRHPHVKAVQIIFNIFRMKPLDVFFPQALAQHVGVLARVPLASGLLTGRMRVNSSFHHEDHRHFNREGERFDKGETFSGVPFNAGLEAVDELRPLVPDGVTMAQFALRWILMHEAVSCAIPGAKTQQQARENAAAADVPALSEDTMADVRRVYDSAVAPLVADSW